MSTYERSDSHLRPAAQPVEAEGVRKFTRAYALMTQPWWLPFPFAVFWATEPLVRYLGYLESLRYFLVALSAAATAVSAIVFFWYRRTYGVVTLSYPRPWAERPETFMAIFAAVVVLEVISLYGNLGVHLGVLLFGAWSAWAAVSSDGFRKHLFVPAAVFMLVAFVPVVTGDTELQFVVVKTAFGLCGCFVWVADYLVARRILALHAPAAPHGR